MLRVIYEAVEDLRPGKIAEISEQRGGTRVRIARWASVEEYARALNEEMSAFLDRSAWFQIWRDEIVSRSGGTCSLSVIFTIRDLAPGDYVLIWESKGLVDIQIERTASAEQFVRAVNPAIEKFLDGAQWFQLWQGEIVDMASPDDPRQGGSVAGIRRGPLVHETP
ncbi:hypothetical protein SMD44_01010 [Streptomyces alboflavus]|uniref:Uncharacterized protein n=1 Tax=Streptomyces alboflavus TaxID=67267 RepID=A0A1Z1W5E0_9ACTN|nr:hypothetical protein [Streptomyces alboflavus]ARX81612.1 hypothetical protein SMD44_01010 [Streptomyces alboflavus]